MAKQLFMNNAGTTLANGISPSATLVELATGTGALFPNPGANEYFMATIFKVIEGVEQSIEVVKCTARNRRQSNGCKSTRRDYSTNIRSGRLHRMPPHKGNT